MVERRSQPRVPVNAMLNKYIDGYPHACRALDISRGGVLVRRFLEPEHQPEFYPLEIGVPGIERRIWVWTRTVWSKGKTQALRFVSVDPNDRAALEQFIDVHSRAR